MFSFSLSLSSLSPSLSIFLSHTYLYLLCHVKWSLSSSLSLPLSLPPPPFPLSPLLPPPLSLLSLSLSHIYIYYVMLNGLSHMGRGRYVWFLLSLLSYWLKAFLRDHIYKARYIVSWPNPKQRLTIHTFDLMIIIRSSTHILIIITREMGHGNSR